MATIPILLFFVAVNFLLLLFAVLALFLPVRICCFSFFGVSHSQFLVIPLPQPVHSEYGAMYNTSQLSILPFFFLTALL